MCGVVKSVYMYEKGRGGGINTIITSETLRWGVAGRHNSKGGHTVLYYI